MALEPGAKLGPYEILAPIETDTESYKAADTRLKRTVTVKLYPPHVSSNSELKQRLEREMLSVAALKHPHICALYDVVHEGVSDYLVTEYLEGETLAERLKRGPMDFEDVLKVAIAMADALDKAHRLSVTHRGLNPSNVILTADGAKLVNFGFAKTSEPSSSSAPVSVSQLSTRTLSSPALTFSASSSPYLAPEQFEGKEPDARTDIFSFGAVLYEMLAGRPAFDGKTPAMLMAAIQTVDPEPVSKFQPAVPPALEYVVKQCLAKEPGQRLQTTRDLLCHLQWISEAGGGIGLHTDTGEARRKRDRVLWIAAGALVLLTAGMAPSAYRYFGSTPEPAEMRFTTAMPGTGTPAGGTPITVSPDGRWVASARTVPNNGGVYLLPLGSVTSKLLLDGRVIWALFWGPDSKSFAFFDDGKLKTSDVSGAPPQTISDAPFPIGGGTWGSQGVIVFASGGVLHRVQAAGGQPAQISTLDSNLGETEHLAPNFLPDGRHFLYLSVSSQPNNSAVYVASIDSKERTRLFASDAPALYAAPGYVLFNRGNAVFAQPFDAGAFKLGGEPVRLSDSALRLGVGGSTQLTPNEGKLANMAVSQTGVLTYRPLGTATPSQSSPAGGLTLTWYDRNVQTREPVGTAGPYAGVDVAPDGKRFAVHQHEGAGGDSWFFDSGRMQRLTFDTAQDNSSPVWSHDGNKIAFGSRRNGKWGLYVKAADGTGPEEMLVESETPKSPMSWSPDGKLLVYWVNDPKTRGDVWMVPLQGDRKPVALLQTLADELLPQVSPDGKWIAYQSDETGMYQIYVRPFPEGSGNKSQISAEGSVAVWPRWRGDGKELFFDVIPNMMAVDIRVTGSSIQPGVPHILFPLGGSPIYGAHTGAYHRYGVTPDGQRFLIPQPQGTLTAVGGLAGTLAATVDQNTAGGLVSNVDTVTVVLNWMRDLKRK